MDNVVPGDKKGANDTKKKRVNADKDKFDEYVKGPEKFPIEPERIGYLPIKIQMFLETDNTKCHISDINTNIKKNVQCLGPKPGVCCALFLRKNLEIPCVD